MTAPSAAHPLQPLPGLLLAHLHLVRMPLLPVDLVVLLLVPWVLLLLVGYSQLRLPLLSQMSQVAWRWPLLLLLLLPRSSLLPHLVPLSLVAAVLA